jgi:drug/metabolite transporter superfamily protein YnfA
MLDAVLSLLVLAAIALIIGAFMMWRRTGNLKNALLMVLLAAVALVNVAIWTLPDASGDAPLEKLEQGTQ